MVLGLQHVVFKRGHEHKTLKVGSILWITGTLTPYGRVDGYYFGSVTKPDYIVRLFPDFQSNLQDPHVSFMREFAEHIDEEDLYKRFHDPLRQEFDFFDEEKEEVIDCDSTTTKMSSEEENSYKMVPGMTLVHQHFRSSPNLGAQGSTGQNDFHQPETYQQNQSGIVPHLVPSLAPVMPMMNNQLLDSRSRQNLGAQGSTMFAGDQNKFNQQPFGMQHQFSLTEIDPLMSNQPNQMGIISNLALRMITADLMMNLQQYLHSQISNILQVGRSESYGVDRSYSNRQHFGLPQTQQMESQVFHPGPSPYRGRSSHHTRARGRGRKRSMLKYNKPM